MILDRRRTMYSDLRAPGKRLYRARLIEKTLLTPHHDAEKRTSHLVLSPGESLSYEPGDAIGICPENSPTLVAALCDRLDTPPDESLFLTRYQQTLPLEEALRTLVNLSEGSPAFVKLLRASTKSPSEAEEIDALLADPTRCRSLLTNLTIDQWLTRFPGALPIPDRLIDSLRRLLPRFYSIASSQKSVGHEIHLLIRHMATQRGGETRLGICTEMLCHDLPIDKGELLFFLHPAPHFRLPSDPQSPLIMVGAGTGVAPYRAFLQERLSYSDTGEHWLFFGEWTAEGHYFYRPFWEEAAANNRLRISTAFSRESAQRIYVQDRLLEESPRLWEWLQKGAYLYLCGDAKKMAPAVEQTLQAIAREEGDLSAEAAQQWLRSLRKSKQYQRDVY